MVKREENNRFPRRASFETPCHVDSLCTTGERKEREEEEGILFHPLPLSSLIPRSSFYHLLGLSAFFPLSLSQLTLSSCFLTRGKKLLLTRRYPSPILGREEPPPPPALLSSLSLSLSLLPRLLSARVLLLCRMYIREAMEVPRGQPIAPGRTLQPRASAAD